MSSINLLATNMMVWKELTVGTDEKVKLRAKQKLNLAMVLKLSSTRSQFLEWTLANAIAISVPNSNDFVPVIKLISFDQVLFFICI